MSNGHKNPEETEAFTKSEKRVLLSETTFVSVGVLVLIVSAVGYVVTIGNKQEAQAQVITKVETDVAKLEVRYLDELRENTKALNKLNGRMSRLEGKWGLPPMPDDSGEK